MEDDDSTLYETEAEEDFNLSASFGPTTSSVDLIDMLNNNEVEKFKETIAVPRDLEETEDLKVIINNCANISGQKVLSKMIFNFLCCLAGESYDPDPSTTFDRYMKLYTSFDMWKQNISMKEEFVNGVLKYFPDQKLPDYCNYPLNMPTKKFISKIKHEGKSDIDIMCYKFGRDIKTQYDYCRKEINSFANPLWVPVEKLPSGVSVSQFLYFIRKQLWPKKALELAKYKFKSDNKKINSPTLSVSEVKDVLDEKSKDHFRQ
jgi:hypothetical protein